jgi:hypothetical protein
MAKTKKPATPAAKRKVSELLASDSIAEQRQACGLTMTDAQIEFFVKLVKAAQ